MNKIKRGGGTVPSKNNPSQWDIDARTFTEWRGYKLTQVWGLPGGVAQGKATRDPEGKKKRAPRGRGASGRKTLVNGEGSLKGGSWVLPF